MRDIVSPLDGFSPFGPVRNPFAAYAAGGFTPETVAGYDRNKFRADGVETTASGLVNFSTNGLRTMTDSDGFKKWPPHNFLTYSEDFSNAAWIDGSILNGSRSGGDLSVNTSEGYSYIQQPIAVTFGVSHTIEVEVVCDTTVSNVPLRAGLGISNDTALVNMVAGVPQTVSFSVTPTSTAFTLGIDARNSVVPGGSDETGYIVTIRKLWAYRSDLGGMAPVPEDERVAGSTTYVPTTDSAVYLPRRNAYVWNGTEYVNEGIQIESEARTNLIPYSQDFTDASWSKTNSTVSAGSGVGLDGENSATKLVPNNAASLAASNILDFLPAAATTDYTFSVYAKAAEFDIIVVSLERADDSSGYYFDLSSGTVGSRFGSTGSAEIEDVGNGWYRCIFSKTSSASTSDYQAKIYTGSTDPLSGTGDGTSGVLIYGAQFEQGSTPSSYIPTNGSTVTRPAETLTIPSENLPWSGTAVSIALDSLETYADEGTAGQVTLADWRTDANNRITLTLDTDSTKTGTFTLTMVNGGSSESISTTGEITPGINKPFNVAIVATSTELGIALDGTAETRVSHSIGLPDLEAEDLELEGMGYRSSIRVWGEDITDTGIAEATA